MEPVSNVEKKWRTRQEKDELIALWKQSGKSRKLYCNDQGLNYTSFVSWHQRLIAKAKTEIGFSQTQKTSRLITTPYYYYAGLEILWS